MLGLQRGIVQLVDHDETWSSVASETIEKLKTVLGPIMVSAEHVGSTSIKWIKAKPIIDLAVGVSDFKPVYTMVEKMHEEGFIHKSENDNEWQVFFSCGKPAENIVTHHVHVVIFGGNEWQNFLLFRDYMNKNREAALLYQRTKEELMAKFPFDRPSYTDGKAEFILSILDAARRPKAEEAV